ncbi:MAG: hypothetical protein CMM56_04780 [Rhodospirillaceae bacterium]|nr:hypothetical protein [Rhodospirillaceae bacterium]|tara:strand:- start:557 stop:1354 length:798 start_codon:yes stop_codon:yes gene_type:complete
MGQAIYFIFFITLLTLSCGKTSFAQFGTGSPVDVTSIENGPAPIRDLSGVWTRLRPEGKFYSNSTWTPDPPMVTSWGQERFSESRDSNAGSYSLSETNDPVLTRCYPPGVPRVYFHPYPFEVIYTEKQMIILYEYDHTIRRVYTDGRMHPEDSVPLWQGHSIGEWKNESTFVITTVSIDERTWLDRSGYQHSDQLRVTEVFRRIDNLHLEIDIIMEDEIALTEPWIAETLYYRLAPPHWELSEISCSGDYLDFSQFESFLENPSN